MIVVDASVVFPWIVEESGGTANSARELLKKFLENSIEVIAPDLLLIELGNILSWKTALATADVMKAWDMLLEYRIPTVPSDPDHIKESIALSRKFRISVYDAVYVVLAYHKKCQCVTADRKLVAAVGQPYVRLLSDKILQV